MGDKINANQGVHTLVWFSYDSTHPLTIITRAAEREGLGVGWYVVHG